MEDRILYITILGSLLIAIILVYFFASILRYHRRYTSLQKERIFAEITIQENERKRIANDLHDSLGPLLSTVKLNINSIEVKDNEDKQIVERAGHYIDEIIRSMRQISYNLLPNTLERKGLVEAIREFTNQMNHKHAFNIQLYVMKEVAVPKEKEIHIFRMLQEIVHNAIKHSKAKNLQIGLSEEEGHLLLLTKDDGVGFDVDKIKSSSAGLGLKSLESRGEILKSVMSMESKPGAGTNYFIKIPLV